MNYKTLFYFVLWMLTKLWNRLSAVPKSRHRAFTNSYKESPGFFVFMWLVATAVSSTAISLIVLIVTRETDDFVFVGKLCLLSSLFYFLYIVFSDQFQQFDEERQRTWQHLKD